MKVLVFAFCSNLRYINRAHIRAVIWRTVHEHIVNEELFNASSSWTARKSCGNMYRDERKVSSVNSEPSQSSWRCVSSFASFESFAFHFIFGWASADFTERTRVSERCSLSELCFHRFVHPGCLLIYVFFGSVLAIKRTSLMFISTDES